MLLTDHVNPDWDNIRIWEVTVKVADFGLSKLHDHDGDLSFVMSKPCGTSSYMAPEVLLVQSFKDGGDKYRGNWRLDVFSLGVVTYELLTGSKMDGGYF